MKMGSQSEFTGSGDRDRVHELTWALLDEQISEDDFVELNNTLLRDDKSRDSYLGCVQLHADLMAHFAAPAQPATKRGGNNPILGLDMPLGFQSPSAEETASQ